MGLDASLCEGKEWEEAIAELLRVGESTVSDAEREHPDRRLKGEGGCRGG
jgi:hypothetical protein